MKNCTIVEPLSILQYKQKKYVICPIHDREGVLVYWYSVLSKETYDKLMNSDTAEEYEKYEDELTNKATDIRKLLNFDEGITMTQILFHRKEVIVPLIREAVRKEYVKPI